MLKVGFQGFQLLLCTCMLREVNEQNSILVKNILIARSLPILFPILHSFHTGIMAPLLILKSTTPGVKPDLSYLPTFNDVGGRPNERRGTRGSFTPGVRIMSGGERRDVPLEVKIDPGNVLFVSNTLKPDLSGEARTNALRPTERLGSRGGFTPGVKIFLGGVPRNIPIKTQINPGQVLFVSCTLQPDMSGEARTNALRPSERLGSRGRFTPGVRHWLGGTPRDVSVSGEIDHGEVVFVSSNIKPDLSWEGETNVLGGRDGERLGRMGSFEHGVIQVAGGPLHMPPPDTMALWNEPGQTENKFRRCGPSHFVAGVSIFSGGMPMYTLESG